MPPRPPVAAVGLALLLPVVFLMEALVTFTWGSTFNDLLFQVTPLPWWKPWTLLTNPFGHLSWGHVLGNAAGVVVLAWPVERRLGWERMLGLFAVGGGAAGWAQALASGTGAVGASGGVLLFLGFDLVLVWQVADERGTLEAGRLPGGRAGLAAVTGVLGMLFLGPAAVTPSGSGAGGVAHLVGFLLGVAVGWRWTGGPGSPRSWRRPPASGGRGRT